jgi:hypothetical protein
MLRSQQSMWRAVVYVRQPYHHDNWRFESAIQCSCTYMLCWCLAESTKHVKEHVRKHMRDSRVCEITMPMPWQLAFWIISSMQHTPCEVERTSQQRESVCENITSRLLLWIILSIWQFLHALMLRRLVVKNKCECWLNVRRLHHGSCRLNHFILTSFSLTGCGNREHLRDYHMPRQLPFESYLDCSSTYRHWLLRWRANVKAGCVWADLSWFQTLLTHLNV